MRVRSRNGSCLCLAAGLSKRKMDHVSRWGQETSTGDKTLARVTIAEAKDTGRVRLAMRPVFI